MRSERLASSSLSGDCIEPETSTRKVSRIGLRSATLLAFVLTPTRTIWRPGLNGDGAASMSTANGDPAGGAEWR